MPYVFTPQQYCLFTLARRVWNRRGAAKLAGLQFNEETVTETMLLELKLEFPGRVIIQPFSKRQEAKTGADWAWAFVSADGAWSQSMLVQAKRLDDSEKDYSGIDRNVSKAPTPPAHHLRQIEMLIDTAKRLQMPAVYALYNHLRDTSRLPQRCRTFALLGQSVNESWGVSLALANHVQAALPDQSFDTHRRHSIPFHCLLCSSASGRNGAKGSASAATNALNWLARAPAFDSVIEPGAAGPFEPRSGLDRIFELAQQVAELDDPDMRDERAELLGREFSGVAGTVLLRDGTDHALIP